MVTLVNKGTASASEILAGSLQDNKRSTLMGEQTYGKGLIQSLKSLGEESGIAITVASYLTPQGNNIQGCLLYTSPSPRDRTRSRMPSSA